MTTSREFPVASLSPSFLPSFLTQVVSFSILLGTGEGRKEREERGMGQSVHSMGQGWLNRSLESGCPLLHIRLICDSDIHTLREEGESEERKREIEREEMEICV